VATEHEKAGIRRDRYEAVDGGDHRTLDVKSRSGVPDATLCREIDMPA
jgi:hypothetical protein